MTVAASQTLFLVWITLTEHKWVILGPKECTRIKEDSLPKR